VLLSKRWGSAQLGRETEESRRNKESSVMYIAHAWIG
jgi:hypothetical protein